MKNIILKFFSNKLFRWSFILIILVTMLVSFSNWWIISSTRTQLYTEVKDVPFRKVGLVLGTSAKARNGNDNLFFNYRLQAAADLFNAGKIKHIIVSGDNHIEGYDEPTEMKNALVAMGVPDSCITCDYAGFRTLDSVIRCREIFGQDSFTIISQEFHNQRAVFIANKNGMDAIGFNAKDVPARYSLITSVRECFAKFKAVLDIYILHTQPKFLGEKVKI